MAHEKYPDNPVCKVITIQVLVNGKLEYYRSAALTGTNHSGVSRYKTNNGKVISHLRDFGYKAMAARLLEQ